MTLSLEQVTLVVPSIGRPSLDALLASIDASTGPAPAEIVVVDDRPPSDMGPLAPQVLSAPLRVLRSGGRGPAAARNRGWRAARTDWIAFLDDDVVVSTSWLDDLAADLAAAGPEVCGVQGQVGVPLPVGRRPTDWERSTHGLSSARWITADMAYRRCDLQGVGGFDERFPRAFREDADLALRLLRSGRQLQLGRRRIAHPVRPAGPWVSVRTQAGNADDVLMGRLHGRTWRQEAGAPAGRRRRHVAVTAALVGAGAAALTGHRRTAAALALGWLAGTTEFALARIAPGPRTREEVRRMLVTSALIPPVAVAHTLRGLVVHRSARPWPAAPDAVLFDRDGTLVVDVPYNGDPERVRPVDGARDCLDRLREAGLPIGVVTNQSGVARGLLSMEQVQAVNARVEQLLGPFDVWQVCVHDAADGCDCRKPAPGMVQRACTALGVDPGRTVLVGDIGSDVAAAEAAGASAILVPTGTTRDEEVAAAPRRAPDLGTATEMILAGAW